MRSRYLPASWARNHRCGVIYVGDLICAVRCGDFSAVDEQIVALGLESGIVHVPVIAFFIQEKDLDFLFGDCMIAGKIDPPVI